MTVLLLHYTIKWKKRRHTDKRAPSKNASPVHSNTCTHGWSTRFVKHLMLTLIFLPPTATVLKCFMLSTEFSGLIAKGVGSGMFCFSTIDTGPDMKAASSGRSPSQAKSPSERRQKTEDSGFILIASGSPSPASPPSVIPQPPFSLSEWITSNRAWFTTCRLNVSFNFKEKIKNASLLTRFTA